MIEVEMPKDITKYEAKLAGIATVRQAEFFGLGAVLGLALRSATINMGYSDIANYVLVVGIAIPASFAVFKPYGMYLEDFIVQAFINNVMAPAKRKYEIENAYASEYTEIIKEERKVIGAYNVLHGVSKARRAVNDPKDIPRKKVNAKNPELTGYL